MYTYMISLSILCIITSSIYMDVYIIQCIFSFILLDAFSIVVHYIIFPYLDSVNLMNLVLYTSSIYSTCIYAVYLYITVKSLFGIPYDGHLIYSYFPFIFSL